jgi:hypothetical protein
MFADTADEIKASFSLFWYQFTIKLNHIVLMKHVCLYIDTKTYSVLN